MILGTLFFAITLNNVGDGRKIWQLAELAGTK
jgi:hypothetical protein